MKQNRYKYHYQEVPLYRGGLHVCIGHNLNDVQEAAGFPLNPDKANQPEEFGAACFEADQDGSYGVFMLFRPDASPGFVAHEAVHAANYIMAHKGLRADLNNDEPQAYLTEWVVDQVHHALTSKQVKPRKHIKLK